MRDSLSQVVVCLCLSAVPLEPSSKYVHMLLFTQEASWVVYEIISSSDMDFYCVSLETSIDLPYPVEATWICKSTVTNSCRIINTLILMSNRTD